MCGHFENSLQKVADIITTSMYQNQEIGFSVVRCSSLDEVKRYGVSSSLQLGSAVQELFSCHFIA